MSRRTRRSTGLLAAALLAAGLLAVPVGHLTLAAATTTPSAATKPSAAAGGRPEPTIAGDWASWQRTLSGSRYAGAETAITPQTVGQLSVRWAFTFPRIPGVYPGSQPAVAGDMLYVGSTDAKLYALNARTGAVQWSFDLTQVTGPATNANPDPVRDGPAVSGASVYFGDSHGYLFSVNRFTGHLQWATLLDTVNPDVRLTGSPVVFGGRVYIGVSNQEGTFQQTNLNYPCCTARGELVAVNALTGAVVWRHYTLPPAQATGTWPSGATEYGPSGGSVWGTPAIDPRTRTIYVGTANNYTGTEGETDSVLALSLDTGQLRWQYHAQLDEFTNICGIKTAPPGYCPGAALGIAHDWDFSASPNLFRAGGRELVGIGAKSGVYRVLDASTGELLWSDALTPNPEVSGGGAGVQWGTSFDGTHLYVATWGANPGTLYALDPLTGAIVWHNAGPTDGCTTGGAAGQPCALALISAVSSSPGLVFEGSSDGKEYAFSASTGDLLWQFDTAQEFQGVNGPGHGESVSGIGGAVIAHGMVYVQSGYYPLNDSPEGTVLLAFGLPQQ